MLKTEFPEYSALREEYGEKDSDIYVSTYSRSGTTWMQIILYQLTTAGEMDFDHIFDVSPWLYYSALRGEKPAEVSDPRILKTHDFYDFYPAQTKGKFVYVVRDGRDVAVSFFHHRRNARGYEGSFEEHFDEFIDGTEYSWFDHVRGWFDNANDFPILFVRYEDLIFDFEGQISRIAGYCGIELTEEILDRVKERASFSYMKEKQYQLGPRPEHFNQVASNRYSVRNMDQFVRKGIVGEGKLVLTEEQQKRFQQKFDEKLGDLKGLQGYKNGVPKPSDRGRHI